MARNMRQEDGARDPLDPERLPREPAPPEMPRAPEPLPQAPVPPASSPGPRRPGYQAPVRPGGGRRFRPIEPPVVAPPPTTPTGRGGTFATPAVPASMTPFRTPAFRPFQGSPFSPSGGFGIGAGGNGEGDDIEDYLRRIGLHTGGGGVFGGGGF